MSSRPNIDDLFRKELDGMQHEYSEALWQKLDTQLQPGRDAYNKKDKKRRAAWLVLPLALLIGGATWYFAGRSSSSDTPGVIATNTENNTGTSANKPVAQPGITTPTTEPANTASNATPADVQKTQPDVQQPANTGETQQVNTPATVTSANNNVAVKQNNTNSQQPVRTVTAAQKRNKPSVKNNIVTSRRKNNKPVVVGNNNNDATASKGKQDVVADKGDEGVVPPVEIKEIAAVEDNPVVKQEETPVVKAEAPVQNKTDTKPEENKTAKPKPTANKTVNQTKLGVSATAGINLSSPFRKPGAFGGVLLTKTIDGKHIFAGLKISSNQLDHQLVFSDKQNQPVVQTDAVIEKLTILQMPFGYEFKLNGKGKPATTFLQAGFEPAYIVGLRTIYYDDNGIPGGPRTPVINSPLMSKAINKFNLSFIAGIRKQITPRIGITLSGGYSLIDITDRQYYNRTSTNNNLKYIQAGMLFRLNK